MKAFCNNIEGSYNCSCKEGYYGDGRNCTGKGWEKKCSHGDRLLILEKNITFQKKDNESQVWWIIDPRLYTRE